MSGVVQSTFSMPSSRTKPKSPSSLIVHISGSSWVFDTETTSSTAALVRHLGSHNLSTQLHCVFDDKFETVFGLMGSAADKLSDTVELIWSRLFDESRDWFVDISLDHVSNHFEYGVPDLEDYWLSPDELRARRNQVDDLLDDKPLVRFEPELVPNTPSVDRHVRFDDATDLIDFESLGDGDGTIGTVDGDIDGSLPVALPTATEGGNDIGDGEGASSVVMAQVKVMVGLVSL